MSVRVSVAMATYNGEQFIEQQIYSILDNLEADDELIISDDGSTDSTLAIVKEIMKNNKQIILLNGPKEGVIRNFENALMHCNGQYIFLSDQDDVWVKNKVKYVLESFQTTGKKIILHDGCIMQNGEIDENATLFQIRNSDIGYMHNIVKNSYVGCCMAFNKEVLNYILPMPKYIDMHDSWIGLMGDLFVDTYKLEKVLTLYRRHEKNVTAISDHGTIFFMVKKRLIVLVVSLIRFLKKKRQG